MLFLAVAVAAVALVVAAYSVYQQLILKKRFEEAMGSSDGQALEQLLGRHHKHMSQIDGKLVELIREYERLAKATGLASQKLSIVRFNPFGDTGGDQSFCLAVLDAHDSGYVLTSIHGREGTRVYVKPVDLGKSKYTLSKEEQQALAQAAKRVPN